MKEKFSLKDHLFNPVKVSGLTQGIQNVYPEFQAEEFSQTVIRQFPKQELKERMNWICECLKQYLPKDFRKATQILLDSLPPECDPTKSDDDFGDFIFAPYSEFVARYGCNSQDLAFSLEALKTITTRFSAEGAIRSFINAFPKETLVEMSKWTQDSHYHVRRLASEGTRPRLPWCQKIFIQPEEALPILHQLYSDPTRFVTRSVANHLNDIAKLKPELVLDTLRDWQTQQGQRPEELDFMIRHSLRTLVKQGHAETLLFLGYSTEPNIQVTEFKLASERVKLGEAVSFSLTVETLKDEKLVIDYSIYFRNKKGQLSPKVFKIKTLNLKAGQSLSLQKKHPLKLMTTKQLYAGQHEVELQINGQSFGKKSFWLDV